MRRIAQRDREAFALFYDRLSGVLYATALRILRQPEDAQDVLQDVFLQIWEKAPAYDPTLGRPFSWAMTLTRNRAIDRLRFLRRRFAFVEDEAAVALEKLDLSSESSDAQWSQEQTATIRSAVAALPLEQRQAIEMAFLGGLTQTEISEALKQPLGTVKARIRRGMIKLRDGLKDLI